MNYTEQFLMECGDISEKCVIFDVEGIQLINQYLCEIELNEMRMLEETSYLRFIG